jgi:RNA polymerase sigma-70 factor (ECF subfamily)
LVIVERPVERRDRPTATVVPPATGPGRAGPAGRGAGASTAGQNHKTAPIPDDLKAIPLGRASDEELMRRTQAGDGSGGAGVDRQAFSLLYERYSASVLSYLYRMLGNVEDVESIGQEVFLRAYRFRATYRYPQKFSTWLFTITRNLAINNARRKKRSPVRNVTELNLEGVEMSGDPYGVAARATDDVERREQIARVLKALDDLPTDQREVIVLGVFQDLSYAQMEEITGAKAVTLRSRMFHGLRKLARMLGGTLGADEGDDAGADVTDD